MSARIATAMAIVAVLAAHAEATPVRAGLIVAARAVASHSDAGPTMEATGAGLGLRLDIGMRRDWALRIDADATMTGEVAVDERAIAGSAFLFGRLGVGATHAFAKGWQASGVVGGARVLYFSYDVYGDSGYVPAVAAEVAYSLGARTRLELALQLEAEVLVEPSATRMLWTTGLALGVTYGR